MMSLAPCSCEAFSGSSESPMSPFFCALAGQREFAEHGLPPDLVQCRFPLTTGRERFEERNVDTWLILIYT